MAESKITILPGGDIYVPDSYGYSDTIVGRLETAAKKHPKLAKLLREAASRIEAERGY